MFQDNYSENHSKEVTFTTFKSTSGDLSKTYRLGTDAEIIKQAAARMTSGTAMRSTMDFSQFGEALTAADSRTAFGYGTFDAAYGDHVQIAVDGKEDPTQGILARTQRHLEYRNQAGLLMIDHDPHPRGKTVTPDQLLKIIADILPGFERAAALWRGSLSAGVHREGEQAQSGRGFHLYVSVFDASDSPRFGMVLHKRLWLAGYGYIAISAAGTFLLRGIIDAAVFSSERLDFVGAPVIGEGLVWTPPEPVYREGEYLDTKMLPDLTEAEEKRFSALVAAAKAEAEPERARLRSAWLERQVGRMVKRGTQEKKARETLRNIARDGALFDLYDYFLLDFATLGTVRVSEVLSAPAKFDGQSCSDPFEGRSYGTTTAKFYRNADGGKPFINSQAHGGMKYFLKEARAEQPDTVKWENPKPLLCDIEEDPFPIEALPQGMRDAVQEYQSYSGIPLAMIACSTLASLSLAAQALVDVARDTVLKGPSSLNLIAIADSGERKTSCDRVFKAGITAWVDEERERLKPTIKEAEARHMGWEAARGGLLKAIEKASKDCKDTTELNRRLVALNECEPASPLIPKLFYQDVNGISLASRLAEGWPTASLWTDEGATVTGGNGFKDDNLMQLLGVLNKLWDGRAYESTRRTVSDVNLTGRRLTAWIQMQPDVFASLQGMQKGLIRGTGCFARFLICWPTSTIGSRLYREAPHFSCVNSFNNRLVELLRRPLNLDDSGRLQPNSLKLSTPAFTLWKEYYNDIEKDLGKGRELHAVKDCGAKSADNAARLAALFHGYQHGPEGEIGAETMGNGAEVAAYFLSQSLRVLDHGRVTQEARGAQRLLDWMKGNHLNGEVDASKILTHGPGDIRYRKARDEALVTLEEAHCIQVVKLEHNRTRVTLNPKIINSLTDAC